MNTTNIRFRSNKVNDIERLFHEELDGKYGDGEVRMMLRLLFEAWMGWSYAELLVKRGESINQSELLRFHWALEDLKKFRPIQQIIGWTEFCGCRIGVDESTLIPRPETEEIVEKTIAMYESSEGLKRPKRVLDLCTGSGCIAIALAKAWSGVEVIGVDISARALMKARENAEKNEVRVTFSEADIMSNKFNTEHIGSETLPYPFELIISNPPYVCESERREMRANVLDYEPGNALFVEDDDALCFYRRIAELSRKLLSDEGRVVVEINERLSSETLSVFEEAGFKGRFERDFRGKERMIICERKRKRKRKR